MQQARREERSLGDLFSDLTREISTLVRQEIRLATTEMGHKATEVGKNIGMLAAGGLVLYAGFLGLESAAVFGLAMWLPLWLSALIIGLVVMAVGYFLVRKGMDSLKDLDLAPRETVESVRETAQWAKEQTQ